MKIIQLNEHDAQRVLELAQNQAATSKIWNDYWERVAAEIRTCLHHQQNGQFFQCAACVEEPPRND